jgi:hypothetical protein
MIIEERAVAAPPRPGSRGMLDALIRLGGLAVALAATVVTAVLELYLTPLRLAGVPVPAAVVAAIAANVAIAWFAVETTGRRWALAPPWALWTVLMLLATGVRTREGDQLVAGDDWMALVMILLGSLAFGVYGYRLVLRTGTRPDGPG